MDSRDCLEYVLRERVLETLCVLAADDMPTGIRRVLSLSLSLSLSFSLSLSPSLTFRLSFLVLTSS
jgi:hypothetical protein